MIVPKKNNKPDFTTIFGFESISDIPIHLEKYLKGYRSVEGGYEIDLHEMPQIEMCELVLEGATGLREKVSALKWKLLLALREDGLDETLENAVESMKGTDNHHIWMAYTNAHEIHRTISAMPLIQGVLNLSDQDVDEYFLKANEIEI